jgi:hypothetical protein
VGTPTGEEESVEGQGGVFGGMEVLHCYNPHKTERLLRSRVLQRCYKVLQGATELGPEPVGGGVAEWERRA